MIFLTGIASGFSYSLFKSVSFSVAVINSYFWNRIWTFEKGGHGNAKEFGSFLIVSLIGFAINVGIASLVVNLIGPKFGLSKELWANVGAIIAAFSGMTWNFLGYKLIVFKKSV
jgi:putative flippase GtrA